MRTTINIDEQLLVYAKLQAAQQGCTLKQVIEDALKNGVRSRIKNIAYGLVRTACA